MTKGEWGIRIEYSYGGEVLLANLVFDKGSSSPSFLTNSTIQKKTRPKKIQQLFRSIFGNPIVPRWIGYVLVRTSRNNNSATISNFFPFYSIKDGSKFGKMGIAQLVELRVLQETRKQFPFVRRVFHREPSDLRTLQLQKRGLFPSQIKQGYSIGRAMRLLREKIVADTRKRKLRVEALARRKKALVAR